MKKDLDSLTQDIIVRGDEIITKHYLSRNAKYTSLVLALAPMSIGAYKLATGQMPDANDLLNYLYNNGSPLSMPIYGSLSFLGVILTVMSHRKQHSYAQIFVQLTGYKLTKEVSKAVVERARD